MRRTLPNVDGWELEALGLHNPYRPNRLDRWWTFLVEEAPFLEGDLYEFGVWRGASTVTTALHLRQGSPDKRLHAFDSFSGFPDQSDPRDQFPRFEELFELGRISRGHFEMVIQQNRIASLLPGLSVSPHSISSSGNFSATSQVEVEQKLNYFGLTNVSLVPGLFEDTVPKIPKQKIAGILLDSDLYGGYKLVLDALWNNVVPGGLVFLDEYFSLKFPGPRIAVDEFLQNREDFSLESRFDSNNGFERWWLRKTE